MYAFQSPFYRVFECNVLSEWAQEAMEVAFSPLSIGSLSVTEMFKINFSLKTFSFQSPFYRVFECNQLHNTSG